MALSSRASRRGLLKDSFFTSSIRGIDIFSFWISDSKLKGEGNLSWPLTSRAGALRMMGSVVGHFFLLVCYTAWMVTL